MQFNSDATAITTKNVLLAIPRKWILKEPTNLAQVESYSCGRTRVTRTGMIASCASTSTALALVRLSAKLKREYATAKTRQPTPIHRRRFHNNNPSKPTEMLFFSATVQ